MTVRSREILADPGDPRALPRYLHVVGVVRVLLGDRHGDGGVRALEEPRHHRAFGQGVAVQEEEILTHLRGRDGAAHEVVGAVVELVEERPDLHTRGRDFRQAALHLRGPEPRDHHDVMDPGRGQHAQLPLQYRTSAYADEALR